MPQSRPSTYHSPQSLRSVSDLVDAGLVAPGQAEALSQVARNYATAIPAGLARLIDRTDPNDPIALQFVPSAQELVRTKDELSDPIGDAAKSPMRGLVHRYPDRVLLKPVLVCPVYCRFCFRREHVGDADGTMSDQDIEAALDYVGRAPQVREVILTGGDPLILTPKRVQRLGMGIQAISHVDIIRWHTRIPIAAPERITAEMIQALTHPFDGGKAVWLSIHCNHPRELTTQALQAIGSLRRAGIALISQTVLLRGVNDSVAVLEDLFRALVRIGVKPYYLHHPDLAPGTSHFRLKVSEGQDLVRSLRGRLTGIAQPTYVLDIPGGAGKSPLGGSYWDDTQCLIEDWQGNRHDYPG